MLLTNENSTIDFRPDDIPKSKRKEEVDQSGEKETVEEHLDDDATGGVSGQIKIIADATNETELESLKNIRLTDGRPRDDASLKFLEIIEIRPNDIPKSKREEEVDQSEETVVEHDDATGGVSGQIMTIAGATNETESESLKNIRLTNGRPKDDASSDFLEISKDENQTDENQC